MLRACFLVLTYQYTAQTVYLWGAIRSSDDQLLGLFLTNGYKINKPINWTNPALVMCFVSDSRYFIHYQAHKGGRFMMQISASGSLRKALTPMLNVSFISSLYRFLFRKILANVDVIKILLSRGTDPDIKAICH